MGKRTLLISAGAVLVVALGGLLWYLGSPLFINRTVDEALPFEVTDEAQMEDTPVVEMESTPTQATESATAMPEAEMEENTPSGEEPLALKSGQFVGADDFHRGSGTAAIFELSDGSRLLRLEDFMVTNGPDLYVVLSTASSPAGSEDLGEYIDLGPLKGNLGDQNYEIPADADIAEIGSVVIYCVPFHVIFSYADL